MKYLPVTNGDGRMVIVDDEDYDWLSKYKWCLDDKKRKCAYAVCTSKAINGNKRMHRILMNAQKGQEIDHINRNSLDNRKANLRFCNRAENKFNSNVRSDCKSGYTGVSWHKLTKKWLVHVNILGTPTHVGLFEDIEEARRAYDEAKELALSEVTS